MRELFKDIFSAPAAAPGVQEDRTASVNAFFDRRKVDAKVVRMVTGPVVTRYLLEIGDKVSIHDIERRRRDLGLKMGVGSDKVYIGEAIENGHGYIAIEVPNSTRMAVSSSVVIPKSGGPGLTVGLGVDVSGKPVTMDITKAPHLLIAGQSGSGKSVLLNSILCSLITSYTPDEVRLLIVDPKGTEFNRMANIPHTRVNMGVDYTGIHTQADAIACLDAAVKEMEYRNHSFTKVSARNLDEFNAKVMPTARFPRIVMVIDEFYDIATTEGKVFEELVCRLAAKARSAGIHLILATQRPSHDVITGRLKANLGTRIALRVFSQVDSRVILDRNGAESLCGNGDMLYMGPDGGLPTRLHGCWLPDSELERVLQRL